MSTENHNPPGRTPPPVCCNNHKVNCGSWLGRGYCGECPNKHIDTPHIACACGDSYPDGSYGAGFIVAKGGVCENCDAANSSDTSLEKQARYQDAKGEDWIDEFARTATADEFRGAMRFTIGKYLRRAGKKDPLPSEIRKMRDYCQRWEAYEQALGDDQ